MSFNVLMYTFYGFYVACICMISWWLLYYMCTCALFLFHASHCDWRGLFWHVCCRMQLRRPWKHCLVCPGLSSLSYSSSWFPQQLSSSGTGCFKSFWQDLIKDLLYSFMYFRIAIDLYADQENIWGHQRDI